MMTPARLSALTTEVKCPRGLGAKFRAEYKSWAAMIRRCYSPESNRYRNYGARGVVVCDRWRNSFSAFIADMGVRPSTRHSIDRINVNGNYEPSNCRWSTAKEQNRNRTSNLLIEHDGQVKCLAEWAEFLGVESRLAQNRIRMGWDPWMALITPKTIKGNGSSYVNRKVSAGLCRDCKLPSVVGKSMCAKHEANRKEYSRLRNLRQRKAK
jgi:hypothetical protein